MTLHHQSHALLRDLDDHGRYAGWTHQVMEVGVSQLRSTRFSQSACIHCGRPVVGLPRESSQFGIVPAECQACHKRRIVTDLQRQIADKQRKAVR